MGCDLTLTSTKAVMSSHLQRKDPRSSLSTTIYQDRRRNAALQQQQSARAQAVDDKRHRLTTHAFSHHHRPSQRQEKEEEQEEEEEHSDRQHAQQKQKQKDSLLMTPEWVIDIPSDLSSNWYVMPRPEGQRCLVTSSRGTTLARMRTGRVLGRFQSGLPGGGEGGGGGEKQDSCILDCIYNASTNTYYVLGTFIYFYFFHTIHTTHPHSPIHVSRCDELART